MNAVQTGTRFNVYDSAVQIHNALPAATYRVEFSEREGFWLTQIEDVEVNEKVYGVHLDKVQKVLHSFENFKRNLGVILSGDKGIGKSLFSKCLGIEAMKRGLPLIVIDKSVPGIAAFLNTIQQECMLLFDEYDKTFMKNGYGADPSIEMLSFFDGVSVGKRLCVITCNSVDNLNEFLINRPGRFHYHFKFKYPTPAEITAYLQDNIPEDRHTFIQDVVSLSYRTKVNYDVLRAIAFELTHSKDSFSDIISDLNIDRGVDGARMKIIIHYKDSDRVFIAYDWILFKSKFKDSITLEDDYGNEVYYLRYDGGSFKEGENGKLIIDFKKRNSASIKTMNWINNHNDPKDGYYEYYLEYNLKDNPIDYIEFELTSANEED